MNAFAQAFRYAGAHSKALEMDKIQALLEARGNFDAHMTISSEGKQDLLWWLTNVAMSGRSISEGKEEVTLFTDASNEGWGAHIGQDSTGRRWSQEEKEDHITSWNLGRLSLLKVMSKFLQTT